VTDNYDNLRMTSTVMSPVIVSVGATPSGSGSAPKNSAAVIGANGTKLHAVVVWFG
jgi:hypothetical protein